MMDYSQGSTARLVAELQSENDTLRQTLQGIRLIALVAEHNAGSNEEPVAKQDFHKIVYQIDTQLQEMT